MTRVRPCAWGPNGGDKRALAELADIFVDTWSFAELCLSAPGGGSGGTGGSGAGGGGGGGGGGGSGRGAGGETWKAEPYTLVCLLSFAALRRFVPVPLK